LDSTKKEDAPNMFEILKEEMITDWFFYYVVV
jgi:hypothetical protein